MFATEETSAADELTLRYSRNSEILFKHIARASCSKQDLL